MCGATRETFQFVGRRLNGHQGLWPHRKSGITVSIVQCRICGLLFPNPMPIPDSLDDHYNVEPEKYWTDNSYFDPASSLLSERIETFRRLSNRAVTGCAALDVGAGVGRTMAELQRAGFDVFGIEPSPSFRRAAIERHGIRSDRLIHTPVEAADWRPESFDFINLSAVLEHVVDPAGVLERTVSWLKPAGMMYVEVPSSAWLLSRFMRVFYRLTGSDYVINTSPMHPPYHLYEFGLESFVRGGMRLGYSVASHTFHPCETYLPAWLSPIANAAMRYADTGMQLVVWLQRRS
jgi:2-polyprenyl-3-methyl-5-hydroxy-6-metoxy-1,4-benzoquinol methylase